MQSRAGISHMKHCSQIFPNPMGKIFVILRDNPLRGINA